MISIMVKYIRYIKISMMYHILVQHVIHLKKCLSKFKKESKIKRNWLNNKFYNM